MQKLSALFVCFLFIYTTSLSQIPTETEAVQRNYSESVPYQPREFPDKKSKNKKKNNIENEDREKSAAFTTQMKPVIIPVSVFDQDGKFIKGLPKSAFRIFVDEKEQEFSIVEPKNEPINFILLVDSSASTDFEIKDIQNFALSVVENLPTDGKILIAEFNERFKVWSELTNDRAQIQKAINKIDTGSGTSLYEAVSALYRKHAGQIEGRKALILLTDGVDTTSRNSTYQKSLIEAEKFDLPVYTIYFDTLESIKKAAKNPPNSIVASIFGKNMGMNEWEYELGRFYLNDLVKLSGGRAIEFKRNPVKPELIAKFIAQEMQLKYYLRIAPDASLQPGQRKQIRIRVNNPDFVITSRGSYILETVKSEKK